MRQRGQRWEEWYGSMGTKGKIITDDISVEKMGSVIFNIMVEGSNGTLIKAESLGHKGFGIFRIGYTF